MTGWTTIGKNNKFFSHGAIGSIPQDLKYNQEKTELIFGDNNTIREHVLINPGTKGGNKITKIGNGNLLMGHTHIGHDCIIGNNIVLSNSSIVAGHVQIDSNTIIGGMSGLHQFVHIGEFCMIGGGSMVAQDIPHYCLAEGNRAVIKNLNTIGLRRNIEDRAIIDELKNVYKDLFLSGKPLKDMAKEIKKE